MVAPVAGNHFINMQLTDQEDGEKQLGEIIDGKNAFVIFRKENSGYLEDRLDSLISVYEMLKTKDFEIVEVVISSSNNRKPSSVRDMKYPWISLFDSQGKEGSIRKYRMGKDEIKTFLVDSTGIIVKVNPSVDEILHYYSRSKKN